MDLPDRVRLILAENRLKQKEFAKGINVTESYISKLLRGESGLSKSTALLIEQRYGYSFEWILNGTEPKMSPRSKAKDLSPIQRKIVSEVERLDESDLAAVLAFIQFLDEVKKSFGE